LRAAVYLEVTANPGTVCIFNMRAAVYLEVMAILQGTVFIIGLGAASYLELRAIAGDCLHICFEGGCLPGGDGYIRRLSVYLV
jgi:hypothetical protein